MAPFDVRRDAAIRPQLGANRTRHQSPRYVAPDTHRSLAARFCCDVQHRLPVIASTCSMASARETSHEATRVHHPARRRGAGMAARPARAQVVIPVVGYLSGTSPDDSIHILADFRRGLAETGYVEGRNLAIEYRWLEGRYDRIPMMLGDLVERRVAVIAVANTTTAVGRESGDPDNSNRLRRRQRSSRDWPSRKPQPSRRQPYGRIPATNCSGRTAHRTAASTQAGERSIAFQVNPTNPSFAAAETREVQSAANVLGVDLVVLNASSTSET